MATLLQITHTKTMPCLNADISHCTMFQQLASQQHPQKPNVATLMILAT
jgi:hypothetical protein